MLQGQLHRTGCNSSRRDTTSKHNSSRCNEIVDDGIGDGDALPHMGNVLDIPCNFSGVEPRLRNGRATECLCPSMASAVPEEEAEEEAMDRAR